MGEGYFKNPWNWVHLLGSCVLALSLYAWIISNEFAFIIAFGCGILWECADEAKKRGLIDFCFLDAAGFDSRDLGMDLIGVVYGLILAGGLYA